MNVYPKKYDLNSIVRFKPIPTDDVDLMLKYVTDGCFLYFSECSHAVFRILTVDDMVIYETLSANGTVDSPMEMYYGSFEEMLSNPLRWFDTGCWEVGYFISDIRNMKLKQLFND